MSGFPSFSSISILILLMALPLSSMAGSPADAGAKSMSYHVLPYDGSDEYDLLWCEYVRNHLGSRGGAVSPSPGINEAMMIYLDITGDRERSYSISSRENGYVVRASDRKVSVWMTYQLISFLSETDRAINASDLPPAVFDKPDYSGRFAFGYMDIYSRKGTDPDYSGVLALDSIDDTWGIWGHNLAKVLKDRLPAEAYASTGVQSAGQLCFSSTSLYKAAVDYIMENFGERDTYRFMIMPADDHTVCQCESCRRAGNTPESSSPAVNGFVARLARRFPSHLFFTSYYGTVRDLPPSGMPENTGVMISAIDLPFSMSFQGTPEAAGFEETVRSFGRNMSRIYVWDYIRNFDDYLTPFPCLGIMKARLDYYSRIGVDGVFLNGSGYDFSAYDDLHTYVLSSMMCDADIDVDAYTARAFGRLYPVTGDFQSDFYRDLESRAAGRVLPLYGGIAETVDCFLDPEGFIMFRDRLEADSKRLSGSERSALNMLLTGFHYTSLELARAGFLDYGPDEQAASLSVLGDAASSGALGSYREAEGDIGRYLSCWKTISPYKKEDGDCFIESGASVSGLDPGSAGYLHDGLYGFPTDYHTGWAISSSGKVEVALPVSFRGKGVLEFSSMSASRWRLGFPERIELWYGDRLSWSKDVPAADGEFTRKTFEVPVDAAASEGEIRVVILSGPGKKTAIDELSLYVR